MSDARWHRVHMPRFWLGMLVLADLVLVVPISLPGSIITLVAIATVVDLDPRAPLVAGAGVIAGLPVLVALGGRTSVDGYATVALALVAISIVLLGHRERQRLR